MDAKTAVNLCRKYKNLALSISNREFYSEIADLIEQQEKYAELGRLAVDIHGYICSVEGFGKWRECADDCKFINFCQKRAELLVEVKT
jgi:hypothetical protein